MRGSRYRTTWACSTCKRKFYQRRSWVDHMWDSHHTAVLRKVRIGEDTHARTNPSGHTHRQDHPGSTRDDP